MSKIIKNEFEIKNFSFIKLTLQYNIKKYNIIRYFFNNNFIYVLNKYFNLTNINWTDIENPLNYNLNFIL